MCDPILYITVNVANINLVNLEERVLGSFPFLQFFYKLVYLKKKNQGFRKPRSKINTVFSIMISLYCI